MHSVMICGVFIALTWPGWSEASLVRWIFQMKHIIMEINERMRFMFVASGWNIFSFLLSSESTHRTLTWKFYPQKKPKSSSKAVTWMFSEAMLNTETNTTTKRYQIWCPVHKHECCQIITLLSNFVVAYNRIQQTWRSVSGHSESSLRPLNNYLKVQCVIYQVLSAI